jgi:uncharacterized membrane protein YhaH (DUF805 family)
MSLSKILFSYEGRIPRATFWYYLLAVVIASTIARFADSAVGLTTGAGASGGYGCFTVFLTLLLIATGLAVGVKRCHDLDRSGWYLLWGLIPILGDLWLLYQLGFIKGTVGQNLYGPDPLAANNSPTTAS